MPIRSPSFRQQGRSARAVEDYEHYVTEPREGLSEWMSQLSPATLELAYEVLERQDRRQAFFRAAHQRRIALSTARGEVTLETNYLLLPHSVSVRDQSSFTPYLAHALRLTAKEARQIVAEEKEPEGIGLGEAAPFFPSVSEEDSLLDPGELPPGMIASPSNAEFAEEFRNFVRAEPSDGNPTRRAGRPTLSLTFETPRGELGVSVNQLGLPVHLFSRLPKQHAESIVWMAHEGARRMHEHLRAETSELRRGTFELADLAAGAPKFADLDQQPELAGPSFADEYEQERYEQFIVSLQVRELKEEEA